MKTKHKILTLDEPAFQTWFGRQYTHFARLGPEHALVTEILHNACTSLRALAPGLESQPQPKAAILKRYELDLCTALHALDWLARHRHPQHPSLESSPPPPQTVSTHPTTNPHAHPHTRINPHANRSQPPNFPKSKHKPSRRARPSVETLPLRIQSFVPDSAPHPNPAPPDQTPVPSNEPPLARSVARWRSGHTSPGSPFSQS